LILIRIILETDSSMRIRLMDREGVVKRNALPKAIPLMVGDATLRIGVVSPEKT